MTKKKILTIDDDPFYEQLYKDMFSGKGFEVKHAFDPAEGYKKLKSFRPDLVVLDVMMPEKEGMADGFGLLEAMHENKKFADVPVVIVSALSEESDISRGQELGALKYVPKQDLLPRAFVEEIKKILRVE